MTESAKNHKQKGMPWWRQSHSEILADMNLRSCFPEGKWLEGLGLYMILKALTSAQYEKDEPSSCTFAIGVNYLLGQCEGNISKETLLDYCNRMKMRNVIDNFVVEDFILTITIYRIYDEVDKYRMDNRYAESPKQKSERKEKEKVLKPGTDEHFKEQQKIHNIPRIH